MMQRFVVAEEPETRPRGWLRRRTRGQAALETLLILPTFFYFMLVLVDFGMLTYQFVSVANAAREGARFGAVRCPPGGSCSVAEVRDRTVARSGGVLTVPAEVTVCWEDRNGGAATDKGDSVVVTVNHPYNFIFVPGATIPVMASADMRLEGKDTGAGLPTC
jgi:Flp pilus assembly protein TadG